MIRTMDKTIEEELYWTVDGIQIPSNVKSFLTTALDFTPDLVYRSKEAIQTWYKSIIGMIIERSLEERKTKKGVTKAQLTRFATSMEKQCNFVPKKKSALLQKIYNQVLAQEGLGLLRGFGVAGSLVNPERRLTRDIVGQTLKEKGVPTMAEPTVKEMINAAEVLNEVLGLDPVIKTEDLEEEELIRLLLLAKGMIEPADLKPSEDEDEAYITPEIMKTLEALKPQNEEEEEKEEEKEEQEEKENQASEKGKKEEKPKEKKKETEQTTKKDQKNEEKKPIVVKEKHEKYTRSHALVDALKVGGTKEEMIGVANKLYVEHNGADKEQVAKALLQYVLPSLELLGIISTTEDGKYTLLSEET